MQKLHPNSIWLFLGRCAVKVVWPFIVLIILLASGYPGTTEGLTTISFSPLLIGIVILLFVVTYIWAVLSYHSYRYELREDGFRKEYGVITKRYVTIPYERIQNVDIYRSVVARILGISELRIQTAGASGEGYSYGKKRMWAEAEGSLPGLSHEIAEQMRDELIKRSKGE